MAAKTPKMNISKSDAAKRQLETAISLFFSYGEPVSVHTLTAAAHEILHGICKVRGSESLLKDVVKRSIQKEKQNEYHDMIHEAENFFKHGRRDPDASFEFRPAATEIFIFDACRMYISATTETPKLLFMFNVWFAGHHPFLLTEEVRNQWLGQFRQAFSLDNRSAFYKELSDAYDFCTSEKLRNPEA